MKLSSNGVRNPEEVDENEVALRTALVGLDIAIHRLNVALARYRISTIDHESRR